MAKHDGSYECEIRMRGTKLKNMNLQDQARMAPEYHRVISSIESNSELLSVPASFGDEAKIVRNNQCDHGYNRMCQSVKWVSRWI
jgi:hypothetical protein